MGCFCSCFRVPDMEESDEEVVSDNHASERVVSNNQNSTPLSYLAQIFKNTGTDIVSTEVGTSTPQGAFLQSSSNSRNLKLQGYVAVRGNGAGSGPSQSEHGTPDEGYNAQLNLCSKSKDNAGGVSKDNKGEAHDYASPANMSSEKAKTQHEDEFYSMRDEVECPTCLEEYTDENPKIASKCNHHFHLGCIYEWMERSSTCPICLEEMKFAEDI